MCNIRIQKNNNAIKHTVFIIKLELGNMPSPNFDI